MIIVYDIVVLSPMSILSVIVRSLPLSPPTNPLLRPHYFRLHVDVQRPPRCVALTLTVELVALTHCVDVEH